MNVLASSAATNWRRELATAVRDPDELCDLLRLPDSYRELARKSATLFPLLIPRGFLECIEHGNPYDPVLRQFIPLAEELGIHPGFTNDPLHEIGIGSPGLLRKYTGRALLIAAHACAVHCRYCFRRHFPYEETPISLRNWQPALGEIRRDESLDEVILSGGDPLVRTDDWLAQLVDEIADISHIKRLRIHTRVPVVIPERITDQLIDWLTGSRLAPYFVVHINHPNELRDSLLSALGRLIDSGVVLLCQTVLLKGINDSAEVLARLCKMLVDHRILPYYLHQLDRVAGAAHFEVDEAKGQTIIEELQKMLPGYAVPKYVREVPGAASKVGIL